MIVITVVAVSFTVIMIIIIVAVIWYVPLKAGDPHEGPPAAENVLIQ